MVKSGGSDFWGGNSQPDLKGSGSVGGDLPLTIGLVGSGGDGTILGGSGGLSRLSGCVDTYSYYCKYIILY